MFTEIYIDTAEIGPMKVSLRFTVDIIMCRCSSHVSFITAFYLAREVARAKGGTEVRHPQ